MSENPTAVDIIERSLIVHPTLFREAVIKQAEQHADYQELTRDERARQGARASKNACFAIYDAINCTVRSERERAQAIASETGPLVIALNIACKLQSLPNHVRTAALVLAD